MNMRQRGFPVRLASACFRVVIDFLHGWFDIQAFTALQEDKVLIASTKALGKKTAYKFLSAMPNIAHYQSANATATGVG